MNSFRDDGGVRNGSGIVDVTVRTVTSIGDIRGGLCEIHRDEWELAPRPVQWDYVTTKPGVLRGVHVHWLRWDYIIVLDGHATIGLKDARRDQKSFGRNMIIEVSGGQPTVITIPPGVAHGIFANSALRYLYGLTVAWDGSDENLGCRYDDPTLAIKWPLATPLVLPRDLELPDFDTLLRQYEAMVIAAPGNTIP
jgi:dTDP-4-dehydrorhamnose 3,5-epimerase